MSDRIKSALLILLVATFGAACSSSNDPGSSDPADNPNVDGNSPGTPNPPATPDPGVTDPDPGGANDPGQIPDSEVNPPANSDGSALSHTGITVPRNPVNPVGTAFFSDTGRAQAAASADNLSVVYEVVENHGGDAFGAGSADNCSTLGAQFSSCSVTNLHIKDATGALNGGNWKLYFHSIRRILRVDSDEFSVSFVNGDLNYLEPTDQFSGFSGAVKTVALVTEYSHLIESDFMPRYWLVNGAGDVTLIANTDEDTDESRYAAPIDGENRRAFNGEPIELASAQSRYTRNQPIQSILDSSPPTSAEIQARVIPTPRSVTPGSGSLDISGGFSFQGTGLTAGSINALQSRQSLFMSTGTAVPLSASIDSTLGSNANRVIVDAAGIKLFGADNEALFNAAQTLLSLVQIGVGTIPYITIDDSPRFSYRGMHVDVARNFHSVATIKKLLDQMAAYKLNRLHLHLSDDEGWRLQIASLPELTSVGAKRSFQLDGNGNVTEAGGLLPQLGSGPNTSNQGTGFYTSAEFVDLLQYAAHRHITIIPEFDMPAHARAAVVAMRARAANLGSADDINIRVDDPQDSSRYLTIQHYDDGILNPCIPGTYNFVSTVVNDVKALYDQAGVALTVWHMGGDEANNVFTGNGFQDVNEPNKVPWRGEIVRSEWDFPWERSPSCAQFIANTAGVDTREALQPYFVKRVSQIVANAGISTLYAYQDIYDELNAAELATQSAGVGYWEPVATDTGYENINGFINRGFEAVVAVPDFLYFDFPQEVDPQERGYYWATRFTDTRKVHGFAPENLPQNAETSVNREGAFWSATGTATSTGVAGMQGQLWSETVRTPAQFDYMVFPRLLALAERAWHRASWELDYVPGRSFSGGGATNFVDQTARNTDYALFARTLAVKELPKLDAAGIAYRIPVPGAQSQGGVLQMNSALPGVDLEYSTNGQDFVSYSTGASANGVQAIRARSSNGARTGRVDTLP
ncbi:MAG: carbohydate-binding domain-containing protein [Granulosicoccus sp.]|nr:carbohydate-binding domain-containing protein [Granulosicoccus sp.]